jgi:glycosyltransferase involved in cell wall biosynthesis
MRICYIGDANAIHTQRWVEWFAREHDVEVISTTSYPGLEAFSRTDLPGPGSRMRLLQSFEHVRRTLARSKPDLLHCHYINEAGWFGALTGLHPLVITAWGSDLYQAPAQSPLARRLNPWALRRADAITCDSEDQTKVIRSWGIPEHRVSVIGWGVDLDTFDRRASGANLRRELEIPLDAPVVLSPRQWLANSNIPTIVAAHALLPGDVFLLLKRSSEFEPDGGAAVLRAIESSPARERIRTLDEIPAEKLPLLYAVGDVVVTLCETDGTPASVLEAMALERPVVAFDNPSLGEWLEEPGGRLVDHLEPAAVAQALSGYLCDPQLRARAGRRNREIVRERADRAREFARMGELYARLHGGRRGLERRRRGD